MNRIDEARSMFDAGEPWWPAPLLNSLNQSPDAPADWVMRCFRALLSEIGTSKATTLLADLADFDRLRRGGAVRVAKTRT